MWLPCCNEPQQPHRDRTHVDQILKERDRLLQRTARAFGLSFTVVSFVCLAVPGATPTLNFAIAAPLYAVLAFSQFQLGLSRHIAWVLLVLLSGAGILVIVTMLGAPTPTESGASALMQLATVSVACVAVVLCTGRARIALLAVSAVGFGALTIVLTREWQNPLHTAGLFTVGWACAVLVGVWVGAGVPQAARRIGSIGRAHRAERQASELEAQRRQSARLLHDTVLATLTLLAHSGLGVAPDALRQQAADDAKLLRQLRLGAAPVPASSGQYNLEAVNETVLGTTLESVKERFGRMGLEVAWHGTGQVLLPSDVLDAFLLALAECLENVRRHSGVTEAHVTIVDDEKMVRAMITDSGVGFTLDDVDSARLGFKESVVARLKDVGGHARLFSAPGSGTTVVLEVPR
jgi:signal transduction histidine kinase